MSSNLLATSSQYVRLWEVGENQARPLWDLHLPDDVQPAPVTSFDWSLQSPNYLATSSLSKLCTLWDIECQKRLSQLIAHESSVNGVSFGSDWHMLATGGDDGQVRVFDMRDLKYSTITYESTSPILQVLWSEKNTNLIALVIKDSSDIILVDIRNPMKARSTLTHQA